MDYKKTLNLPSTAFPMKANLSQREPQQLKDWEDNRLYKAIQDRSQGRPDDVGKRPRRSVRSVEEMSKFCPPLRGATRYISIHSNKLRALQFPFH